MAAQHNVHPNQFKLFMGGQEWRDLMEDSVDAPGFGGKKEMAEVWASKLDEAKEAAGSGGHGAGVYDSMKQVGYYHGHPDARNKPTILVGNLTGRRIQGEGHHRIAAAAEIERETGQPVWIPTNYEKL